MSEKKAEELPIVAQIAQLDISAASGCVFEQGLLYAVADDRSDIYVFDEQGRRMKTIPIFPDDMPIDEQQRKKVKPDVESICRLSEGRLLLLGSGSKPNRCRGACFDVASQESILFDVSELYEQIGKQVGEVNIEGCAVVENTVILAQRGNSETGINALIFVCLNEWLQGMKNGRISSVGLQSTIILSLGSIANVPYSITDISPSTDGHLWFVGAAEDTIDPYLDGEVKGAIAGKMTLTGDIRQCFPILPTLKVEGVCEHSGGLWMVCDADDPTIMSPLLRVVV